MFMLYLAFFGVLLFFLADQYMQLCKLMRPQRDTYISPLRYSTLLMTVGDTQPQHVVQKSKKLR